MSGTRNVIVIGPTGCGKSRFLNLLLGRTQFQEAQLVAACTSRMLTLSKNIQDNVNNVEYRLNLFDTPGVEHGLTDVLNALRTTEFNQIVLVSKMEMPLSPGSTKCLGDLGARLQQTMAAHLSSFTLVINHITSRTRDEEIIRHRAQVLALLGLDSAESICVRVDEPPRDCVFRYLVHTAEDGFQFQDRNFLAVISQSSSIKVVPNEPGSRVSAPKALFYFLVLSCINSLLFVTDTSISLIQSKTISFPFRIALWAFSLGPRAIKWILGKMLCILAPWIRPLLIELIKFSKSKSIFKRSKPRLKQFFEHLEQLSQPALPLRASASKF